MNPFHIAPRCLLWLLVGSSGELLFAQQPTTSQRLLAEKSIAPTAQGLSTYLRDLHPSDEGLRRVQSLLAQLGANEFRQREAAMAQLLALPNPPVQQLQAAIDDDDPEVRWRAQKLLIAVQASSDQTLLAVFNMIDERQIAGLTAEVLAALPVCTTSQLRFAADKALLATASKDDAHRLQEAVNEQHAATRSAALRALESILGEEIVDLAATKLDDEDAGVRMTAARALANAGDRRSLAALVKLLAAEEIDVRVQAALTLRQLTGEDFPFSAYDKPQRRAEAIAKWEAWCASQGETAKLITPLRPLEGGRSFLGGNTLLAFGHQNRVVEYDPAGEEIFSWTGKHTWSAEKLPNGNILVASYGENRIVELNMRGEVVWEHPCTTPLNARPLPNGNVLVPEHTKSRIFEVTREHKEVWAYPMAGLTCDAHRLPNGNTLVAGGTMVEEVSPEGKVVWQYEATLPYGIEPLPNGNVIVCDLTANKVFEIDRDKNILWTLDEPRPADAFRLSNGNTLITSNDRFFEMTPERKIIWEKAGCRYGTARR